MARDWGEWRLENANLAGGGVELAEAQDGEPEEEDERAKLGEGEGHFFLHGGEGVQGGDLLKGLHDEDKEIEVLGKDGGDDPGGAPASDHVSRVARDEGKDQDQAGEEADDDAGRDSMEGEEEAGEAGEGGGEEEEGGDEGQGAGGDHADDDDEAGSDADEADGDVELGEGGETHAEDHQSKDHGVPFLGA